MTGEMIKQPRRMTQLHFQQRDALNAKMGQARENLNQELCLLPTLPSLIKFHESGIHHLVESMLTSERKDG